MVYLLKIPFFKQKNQYTCGPVVLEMVFNFFGLKVDEKKIIKLAKTSKDNGTNHLELINTARKEGFHCFVHEHSNFSNIQSFLEEGLPVIVHYTEQGSEIGHYAIVSGWTDKHVILNDPWNGKGFKLKKLEFIKRWQKVSTDSHSHGWIMVLSKNCFSLGREYHPLK